MLKTLALPLALVTLTACAPNAGQNVYSSSEVGVAKTVERCRVLAVRNITIQGQAGRGIGQFVGTVAGGVAGGALGNQVGDGTGQAIATVIGGLAGSVFGGLVGDQVGAQADQRAGLEYSILTNGNREITFAQETLPGDRVIKAGETCRIQTDPRGNNRVLPINGLPPQVQRPQTTTFY